MSKKADERTMSAHHGRFPYTFRTSNR